MAIETGTVGVPMIVEVTGRLTIGLLLVGVLVGVFVGRLVGTWVGSFVGFVDVGPTGGGILAGSCVRGGEVRRGVKAVVGLTEGAAEGLIADGGLTDSGGSDAGESGRSAMTPPVTTRPLTASAPTVRR